MEESKKLGDSKFQRDIEAEIIKHFENKFKFKKSSNSNKILIGKSFCNVDFVDEEEKVFCEIYTCGKTLKSAQKFKVKNDILKLIGIEKTFEKKEIDKCLILTIYDPEKTKNMILEDNTQKYQEALFGKKTWINSVIELFEIKLLYYNLSKDQYLKLIETKDNQALGNRKK